MIDADAEVIQALGKAYAESNLSFIEQATKELQEFEESKKKEREEKLRNLDVVIFNDEG